MRLYIVFYKLKDAIGFGPGQTSGGTGVYTQCSIALGRLHSFL